MTPHLTVHKRRLFEIVRIERQAFAAKIRLTRAVLGWSQSELGLRIGLTQRAIHKLEQGGTEPRRSTVSALQQIWQQNKIEFEDLADGGFRVSFCPEAFADSAKEKRPPKVSQ